jgi:hypothetical protein
MCVGLFKSRTRLRHAMLSRIALLVLLLAVWACGEPLAVTAEQGQLRKGSSQAVLGSGGPVLARQDDPQELLAPSVTEESTTEDPEQAKADMEAQAAAGIADSSSDQQAALKRENQGESMVSSSVGAVSTAAAAGGSQDSGTTSSPEV